MFKVQPIKQTFNSFKKREYVLEFFLTKRCNLNCKNCSRFASFYDKTSDVSFEEFKRDFDHILEFSDFENIKRVNLTGGEPTIIKDFLKIIEYIRSKFKREIAVCSNGATIQTFSKSELERLKKCEVQFLLTKYPCSNINYEKVFHILDQYEIMYERFLDFGEFVNDRYTFGNQYFIPKKLKPVFRHTGTCCSHFPMFYKGKLYICDKIPVKIDHFESTEYDVGVPLKEFKSFKEIIHYFLNDHSKDYFCERCLKEFRVSPWEVETNKNIDFYFMSKKEEEYYCE